VKITPSLRSIEFSLDLGWRLLSILPRQELDRVSSKTLDKFYIEDKELLSRKSKLDLFEDSGDSSEQDEDSEELDDDK